MRFMYLLLFLQLASTLSYAQRRSLLIGETQDCFAGRIIHPAHVDIYLLDPQKSPKIVAILNDMEKQMPKRNNESPDAFFASYQRLTSAIQKTSALPHVRSNKAGKFSFDNVKEQRKLVLLGIGEREDEPAYYASIPLNLRPGKNSVTLDFDRENPCKSQ